MRGLKYNKGNNLRVLYIVAPHVGAWIEIIGYITVRYHIRSHPTWVRGLKSLIGLQSLCHAVAPHVGAWIEILIVLTIC